MLKLPRLDTGTYEEILEDAIAKIPTLTDRWTDFNPQDTGILLLELMAGLTEQLQFMLDQVGDEFLLPYLRLLYGPQTAKADIPAKEALFARECAESVRAVTPEDFERLSLASPFGISRADARRRNGGVSLTIFRAERDLSPGEQQSFYDYLKCRCLLGTRLTIRQAARLETRVNLQVRLDPCRGRVEMAEQKLQAIVAQVLEKPMGSPLDPDELLKKILSVPEIVRIILLEITCREPQGPWQRIYAYPKDNCGVAQMRGMMLENKMEAQPEADLGKSRDAVLKSEDLDLWITFR